MDTSNYETAYWWNKLWKERLKCAYSKKKKKGITPRLVLTCHVLCPPSDIEHGKPPGVHSMRALGWRLSECSGHRCDRAGTSGPGVHLRRSGCRPRAHGSETACWYPVHISVFTLNLYHICHCFK